MKTTAANAARDAGRLETPHSLGIRIGMSSSTVIGRKLERVFDVPAETPPKIDALLQTLDRPER